MTTCAQCQKQFEITDADRKFYNTIDVSAPDECPDCRQQLRLLFRNFKTLYSRTSSKSEKPIISMYAPDVPFPVYEHAEWWSDDWNAHSYARDIDFSRPFFEQFHELINVVPRFCVMNTRSENCLYSNMTAGSKDCYLIFGCIDDERCSYGHIVWNSHDCIDTLYLFKCELCYECIDCINCYKLFYSQDCEQCTDSIDLFDCRDCHNCIGCVGLRNKSYCLFNKQVGKEEYETFLREHPLHDPQTIALIDAEREKLMHALPQRHFYGSRNEDVSGNHIYNAKDVHYSFDVKGGENSAYIFTCRTALDSRDCSFFPDIELGYQNLFCTGRMIMGSHMCIESHDIVYSDSCFSSNNLFGCAGLRNARFCILNKQYGEDEYTALKERLIAHMKQTGEWGRFIPKKLSPFAYNESIANEYTPLDRTTALAQGYRWRDDIPGTTGKETITHENLPVNPAEFSSELAQHILACTECGKNYRFIQQEINFYKQNGIALPRACFNCRHKARMNKRNPRHLWHRRCNCAGEKSANEQYINTALHDHGAQPCSNEFETTYAPDRPELVYCESCYQSEVV